MESTRTCRGLRVGRGAWGATAWGAVRGAWSATAFTITLLGCAHLGAPGPVVADRPGYTDTPVALPAGALQVEAGATGDQTGSADSRTTTVSAGELLLRAGVGARTELRLFGNSYDVRTAPGQPTARGMEDLKVGVKLSAWSKPDSVHAWMPNVAVLAASTSPTGASQVTAGVARAEAKLAMNWTTASPFSLYSNLGVSSSYANFERDGLGWVSAAGWWALDPRLSLFGEAIASAHLGNSLSSGASGATFVDAGVTYLLNDRFQLDVRAGHGVGGLQSTERFAGVGFARRW